MGTLRGATMFEQLPDQPRRTGRHQRRLEAQAEAVARASAIAADAAGASDDDALSNEAQVAAAIIDADVEPVAGGPSPHRRESATHPPDPLTASRQSPARGRHRREHG